MFFLKRHKALTNYSYVAIYVVRMLSWIQCQNFLFLLKAYTVKSNR